jgi:type VI secretion system secreted protein VgrG
MALIQEARPVEITTPLGDDVLLFHRMTADEALGRPFRFDLNLLSKEPDIKFADILGQKITIRLNLPEDKERYFNGFVSRFSQEGMVDEFHAYHMTVHPWLWFLSRTSDCRIFQEKSVPDIIKEVFRDHGFTDFEDALSGSYRTWNYCVQYRETDFNFVSRLMEQEGIYYYFKHQKEKHVLVLSDSISSHAPFPDYEKLPFFPPDEHLRRERDHIYHWHLKQEIQPGVCALNEYDFTRPKANMQVKSSIQRSYAHASLEIFDYPGEYPDTSDGETYARARIEELQVEHEQATGQGNARGLAAGNLFELTDYPREDQNREYLIIAATHQIVSDAYTSGHAKETERDYTCSFNALPSKQPYRQARTTPKPMVQGPQTAVVVGPSGDEIYTEKYGRVKIQFHWDRYGKQDENSSCWVRVSHPTAGKGWGAVQIPRIGQEVIVDFLEGDPDHPIITGRVYNANQMPPYELPGSGMVSGMKSNSTPGGGGYNEISMDDTKGKEVITVHGQYDMNTTVNNDQTNTVGNNQTIDIGVNRTETVGGNDTVSITGNRTETVSGSETVTVSGGRSHSISGVQTTTISVAETHSVGAGRMHNVGAGEMVDVGGVQAVNIGGAQTVTIGGVQAVTVGALQKFTVGGSHKLSAASIAETSKGPVKIKAGATATVEAPTIVLKAGGSKITMDSGGITIKGAKITQQASGKVTVKGGGGIKMKGPAIGEN